MTKRNDSNNQAHPMFNWTELYEIIDEAVERKMSASRREDEIMLTEREAAEFLGVKRQTMAAWRSKGTGPAYSKMERSVRYKLCDLKDYRDRSRVYKGPK